MVAGALAVTSQKFSRLAGQFGMVAGALAGAVRSACRRSRLQRPNGKTIVGFRLSEVIFNKIRFLLFTRGRASDEHERGA